MFTNTHTSTMVLTDSSTCSGASLLFECSSRLSATRVARETTMLVPRTAQRPSRCSSARCRIDARVARNIIRKIRMMNAAAATLKANNKSRAG